MNADPCPKCGGEMDEGRVSAGDELRYVSNRQSGMIRRPTSVRRALVCRTCGFVELYLDPTELRRNGGA